MGNREYDLVVFGATSFVGQILCRRLVERAGTGPDAAVRWAIAGRSASKLAEVAAATGADVPRIVADAADADAMRSLAGSTATVASTVGPYAKYGSALVAAVAEAGTDYCDLTGETQWMRAMIDAHHDTAGASGARVVHTCGFDSIPSDLGVWVLQQAAIERFGAPCTRVGLRVVDFAGKASGGTVASMLNIVDEVKRDPALRKVLANPYALCPTGMRDGVTQPDVTRPQHDDLSDGWVAPFVMAAVNTRVVHRTHALLGRPWGDFRYDEAMATGRGVKGAAVSGAVTGALGALMVGAAIGPTRWIVDKLLPEPGEGPTPEEQRNGHYRLQVHGRTGAGAQLTVEVTGDQDPGYGSTAKMMAEAALAFSDIGRDRVGGGFWTPATMFGDLLVERLTEHAGMTFDVVSA